MRGGLTPSHTLPQQRLWRRELGVAEFMVKTLALPTFGNAHPISLMLANTLTQTDGKLRECHSHCYRARRILPVNLLPHQKRSIKMALP